MSDVDEYMKVREVAEWLNVSRKTVRKWIDAGVLPAIRLPGGDFRIRRADVHTRILGHADAASTPAK